MYAYIKGTLDSIHDDFVIVETCGVGYRIFTSLSTVSCLPRIGEEVKLLTHFIVREDANMLCGFLTNEELTAFEMLLTVSGVGLKVALAVLSAVTPAKFGLAVMTDDYDSLKIAQGVGTKLAQKICFELKDRIKKGQAMSGGAGFDVTAVDGGSIAGRGKIVEAVSALTILGYSQLDANRIVTAVSKDEPELELEDIIREALRQMGR